MRAELLKLPGVSALLEGAFFNEFTIKLPTPAEQALSGMRTRGYLAGLALSDFVTWPEAENALLVAVTEKRTEAEIAGYVAALAEVLEEAAS